MLSSDVRYCTNSGRKADIVLGPLCAQNRFGRSPSWGGGHAVPTTADAMEARDDMMPLAQALSQMKVRWANDNGVFLDAGIMGEATSTKPAAWSGPCP